MQTSGVFFFRHKNILIYKQQRVMLTNEKWAQWKHQNKPDATADEWLASELC